MKQETQIRIAGISGAIAIMAGAFGAHLLKDLMEASSLASFETGSRYHLIHSIVLLFIASRQAEKFKSLKWIYVLFLLGILFFSGSLYALTLLSIHSGDQYNWLGAITPVGGLLLIAGWLLIAFKGLVSK